MPGQRRTVGACLAWACLCGAGFVACGRRLRAS